MTALKNLFCTLASNVKRNLERYAQIDQMYHPPVGVDKPKAP